MVTTSPVIESPQGYWNITGDKPDVPQNVTSKVFSGKLTDTNCLDGLVTHIICVGGSCFKFASSSVMCK